MVSMIQPNISSISTIKSSEVVLDGQKYIVYTKFPFTVKHITDHLKQTYENLLLDPQDIIPFYRRLNAERYRILQFISYFTELKSVEMVKYYKDKDNKLEEEHPEWLI